MIKMTLILLMLATLGACSAVNKALTKKNSNSGDSVQSTTTNTNNVENKNINQEHQTNDTVAPNLTGQVFNQVVHRDNTSTTPFTKGSIAFITIALNGAEVDCSSSLIAAGVGLDSIGKFSINIPAGQYFAIYLDESIAAKDFISQGCAGRGKVKSFGGTGVESIIGSRILHIDASSPMVADSSSDLVIKIDNGKVADVKLKQVLLTP